MKTDVQKGLSKHGAVLINVTSAGYLTVFDCRKICFLGEEDFCKGRGVRRAALKSWKTEFTAGLREALLELETKGFLTATAYRIKEQLRWIRHAESKGLNGEPLVFSEEPLKPIGKALEIFKKHIIVIGRRWKSGHTNARLEGLNGLFQAARARARG